MTAGHRWARPRRSGAPVAIMVVTLVAWFAVAYESGAAWVQAVGVLMTGMLVVGLVAPALALARARCVAVTCPSDGIADRSVVVEVTVNTALVLTPIEPSGPPTVAAPGRASLLELRPEHRGVYDAVTMVIASAAPFGILWWTRRVDLTLPRPLAVAPRTGAPDPDLRSPANHPDSDPAPAGEAGPGHRGELRGVRPYAHGDHPHLVHWPATAHTGELMIKEMERAHARPVTVRAVLPQDPAAAEDAAERVMGTVVELLGAGVGVELVTQEPGGSVSAPVLSATDVGRRLARALPLHAPDAGAARTRRRRGSTRPTPGTKRSAGIEHGGALS